MCTGPPAGHRSRAILRSAEWEHPWVRLQAYSRPRRPLSSCGESSSTIPREDLTPCSGAGGPPSGGWAMGGGPGASWCCCGQDAPSSSCRLTRNLYGAVIKVNPEWADRHDPPKFDAIKPGGKLLSNTFLVSVATAADQLQYLVRKQPVGEGQGQVAGARHARFALTSPMHAGAPATPPLLAASQPRMDHHGPRPALAVHVRAGR